MTVKNKTDKDDTLRYVWLVTYHGRGDDGESDAYEVYSDERAALRAIAVVLRGWVDDPGYIRTATSRAWLDTLLQRDSYAEARSCWNLYANNHHEPAGVYGIDLEDVEFDVTTHLNVKDDAPFETAKEKAPISSDFNPGFNSDGTHPWSDIFVAHVDGTYTCGPCTPRDIDISLDETDVWEVGSNGWTAPVVCRDCKVSIEVVVDGED